MAELGHDRVDVLKMDIEGSEYEVIDQILRDGLAGRIGVMMIEFHHWLSAFSRNDTRKAITDLEKAGFQSAWVSETGHELLFIRPR